ncbi:hypothetical protein EEJ34_18345 [Vibrio cholerae]|nr:hypothetical protein EEJ34_18345 [Vibrio cholerae]
MPKYNKAFKADSQRWAFSVTLNLVFTAQCFMLGGNVAHYLTRRYAPIMKNQLYLQNLKG